MPVSVSYTAAAGLTQTYVADSSDVEFSISDVAVLPNVEAAGNLTDGDELAAYGVSTCADNGVAGMTVSIAEPSQAGQEKTIIFTFSSENVNVEDHDGVAVATMSQSGLLHAMWDGAAWVTIADTTS